jgi:hypothetical protein
VPLHNQKIGVWYAITAAQIGPILFTTLLFKRRKGDILRIYCYGILFIFRNASMFIMHGIITEK